MILYGYWRSSATYRVRIALNLKTIEYRCKPVHLVLDGGQQFTAEYTQLNPANLVPTLVDETADVTVTQSLAILAYLDEAFPESVSLVFGSASHKAQIRAIAYDIACDTQPIANLRVLNYLQAEFSLGGADKKRWAAHWIAKSFAAIETRLQASAGDYCVADTLSLADVCLVPQVYNAVRFGIDMAAFPTIQAISQRCNALPAFVNALPENQPDAMPQ